MNSSKRGRMNAVPRFTLARDVWGRLELTFVDSNADRRKYNGVEPLRAFPIQDPNHWIVLTDADGAEIVCLESLDDLDSETQALIKEELAIREFMPAIEKIVAIRGETTPSEWEVLTDRGPTRFTLDNDDDVRLIGPNRVIITDLRKLRFQVPDIRALDAHSRRALERYL